MQRSLFGALLLAFSFFACSSSDGNGGDPPMGPGEPDFTMDQDIQGVVNVTGDVTIPAGVTSTVVGDLTLNVTGNVTINGTLAGDCVVITINGSAAIVITGTVDNGCTEDPENADPPALSILGDGDMTFDGAQIISAGELLIQNDPTLTDGDFEPLLAPATELTLSQQRTSIFINNTVTPRKPKARNGRDGTPNGGNGRNAFDKTLSLRGDVEFQGGNVIRGQHGGDGGKGTDNTTLANATGGDGGDGGKVTVQASGELAFLGNNTIESGSGGNGGDAEARAPSGAAESAPDADATAGSGGDAGLMKIRGRAGLIVGADLTLVIGDGGNGANATAVGANGQAGFCTNGHAQHGGAATATGGAGGGSPDEQLVAGGNVAGSPTLQGGNGGNGGMALAGGGNGSMGENCDDCLNGGDGGTMTANAGKGGDAQVRNLTGNLVGAGGDGGDAEITDGNGAAAFPDCCPTTPGGTGGQGGDGNGDSGDGGTGLANGDKGMLEVIVAGNGADGGKGEGPGGAGGDNNTMNAMITDPSFMPGDMADPCDAPPPPPPPTGAQIVGMHDESLSRTSAGAGCPADLPGTISGFNFSFDGSNLSTDRGNRITSSISGQYNEIEGSWTATGSQVLANMFTVNETWNGAWSTTTEGAIVFMGTKTIEHRDPSNMLVCTEVFDINFTRTGP